VSSPSVADHVIARLADLGIGHAFGMPGDYAFAIEFSDRVTWVGCSNELNAAYAADSYARIHGAAILTTTFAAGEASALNGVLGSKAERLPVFHLVGTPSSRLVRTHRQLHHTFGDADIGQFRVPSELAAGTCHRRGAARAAAAYITIASDYARMPVAGTPVKGVPATVQAAPSDPAELDAAIDAISAALARARRPVILPAFTLARYSLSADDRDGHSVRRHRHGQGRPARVTPPVRPTVRQRRIDGRRPALGRAGWRADLSARKSSWRCYELSKAVAAAR
jgi:indolepyruvate decarboxylase